jgi:hypothetical protein
MSKRPTVNTNPVAHQYSGPGERIVEFSNNIAADHKGGLIAFRNLDDGRLLVDVYRTDPKVDVRVSARDGVSDQPVMLVYGNPADGFTYVGPVVPNDPELESYIETELHDQYWWYVSFTSLDQARGQAHLDDGDVHVLSTPVDEPDAGVAP